MQIKCCFSAYTDIAVTLNYLVQKELSLVGNLDTVIGERIHFHSKVWGHLDISLFLKEKQ